MIDSVFAIEIKSNSLNQIGRDSGRHKIIKSTVLKRIREHCYYF